MEQYYIHAIVIPANANRQGNSGRDRDYLSGTASVDKTQLYYCCQKVKWWTILPIIYTCASTLNLLFYFLKVYVYDLQSDTLETPWSLFSVTSNFIVRDIHNHLLSGRPLSIALCSCHCVCQHRSFLRQTSNFHQAAFIKLCVTCHNFKPIRARNITARKCHI